MFSVPDRLYHGTTKEAADQMVKEGLINPEKWRSDTDFGPAFYVTTDFHRAFRWQKKLRKRAFSGIGAVVTLRVNQQALSKARIKCFHDASKDWALYVWYHRARLCRDLCRGAHADVVYGPIADNNIAAWFDDHENKMDEASIEAFRLFITSDVLGNRLPVSKLGFQIAFCSPAPARDILQIEAIRYYPLEG
ncbi:MAG TPA: DUF3990 domain-containing protein [Alicyclobacillus sp.]|nr:DUF3990 domain-containing protein [Alicyclobacillus sp.]